MTNFGAKILNNAVSSLAAQQALIANAGNNIANVNTTGYTRRSIELQTRFGGLGTTGIQIGNGVQVGGIRRIADEFLEKLLRESQASRSSYQTQDEFLSRIENLFSLTGDRPTIGSSLTSFYAAINDLSLNPSSIELRSNLIQKAQDLVENIRNTYNTLANLQSEADQRIGVELQTVNSITAQIANLNTLISQREAAGENIIASDERDARDQLLKELSEKLSFNKVELPDGSVTLTLSNGFALVNGSNSRALSLTTAPSFATSTLPPSLGGGVLGYIVYDYSAGSGTAHVDFTQDLMAGGGSIGGLL
ncbi:MAG: flagellar hook-associated protein FlgK, partial [Proteobacteria bacterium]